MFAQRMYAWSVLPVALALSLFAVVFGSSEQPPADPHAGKSGELRAMEEGIPALAAADRKEVDPFANQTVAPDQVIVRFKSTATAAQRAAARDAVDGERDHALGLSRAEVISLPKGSSERAAARKLSDQPGVAYSEPDYVTRASLVPDDTEFEKLWAMNNTGQANGDGPHGTPDADIDAVEAWDTTTGSEDVVVAVVDTGIDYLHEDLAANIWTNDEEMGLDENDEDKRDNGIDDDENGQVDDWRGYNWTETEEQAPRSDPMDDNFHGTHVAGTIGAIGGNGKGVAGVQWHAKLMALKTLNFQGSGLTTWGAEAMEYAAENGAKVVNGSFGYMSDTPSQYERDVIESHPETLFVFAAGNSGFKNGADGISHYPCGHKLANVICVAATDRDDKLTDFSNYGEDQVQIAAPGEDIVSTKASVHTEEPGNYMSLNGTSMATPHVTGAAALLMAAEPLASIDQVRGALLDSAQPIDGLEGKVGSGGRLNVKRGIDRLASVLGRNPANTYVEAGGSRDLRVQTAAGQADAVTVTESGQVVIVEAAGASIVPGRNCVVQSPDEARCDRRKVRRVIVQTGDMNDSVEIDADLDSIVDPGAGDDHVFGGPGDDEVLASDGADEIEGSDGDDTASYAHRTAGVSVALDLNDNDGASGEGDFVHDDFERIVGGSGADQLWASDDPIRLEGRSGDDELHGGSANDELADGAGADDVFGGGGDDSIELTVRDGDDDLWGGDGDDVVSNEKSVNSVSSSSMSIDNQPNDGIGGDHDNIHTDVENLISGDGWDDLKGSAGDNILIGGNGIDALDGGPGGADDLSGGASILDTVRYEDRTDDLTLDVDNVANDGAPGEGDNVRSDIEQVRGGSGNDKIFGDEGTADEQWVALNGTPWAGKDFLFGGQGDDELHGRGGIDTVSYLAGTSDPVHAEIGGGPVSGLPGEADDIDTDVENLEGGHGNDTLIGSDEDNDLQGAWGDDELFGGGGDDSLDGGRGDDEMAGGDGTDTVTYSGNHADEYMYFRIPVSITLDGTPNDGYEGETDDIENGVEKFIGGVEDDTIVGTDGADHLDGSAGDDEIHGGLGNDLVRGNSGEDDVYGDEGDDRVEGDWLLSRGHTYFNGIWFYGTIGIGLSDNRVYGGPGDDVLYGGFGADEIHGEDGDDEIEGGPMGGDEMHGGDGHDSVLYKYEGSKLNISLDGVANDGAKDDDEFVDSDFEEVYGGFWDDTITGDGSAERLVGGFGEDKIDGLGGADTIIGGDQSDDLDGGDEDDFIDSDDQFADDVECGSGDDKTAADSSDDLTNCDGEATNAPEVAIQLSDRRDYLVEYRSTAGVADNVLVSKQSGQFVFEATGHALTAGARCQQILIDRVECAAHDSADESFDVKLRDGNDTFHVDPSITNGTEIDGGSGDDEILGGSGEDLITGGLGADDMLGGAGNKDMVLYFFRSQPVEVRLNTVDDDGELLEGDYVGPGIEGVTGGSGDDILVGNEFDNRLYGNRGDDTLDGKLGADWTFGDIGYDTITYADRTENLQLTPSAYEPGTYFDNAINDLTRSGAPGENDWIEADLIIGGSGDDEFNCMPFIWRIANDFDGGSGADTFSGCDEFDGETGRDSVIYESRTAPVEASIDNAANDGEAGEGDNIKTGVERIVGGGANDELSGDAYPNWLVGNAGDDDFDVDGGGSDQVDCGDGNDDVDLDPTDLVDENCETTDAQGSVELDDMRVRYAAGPGTENAVTVTVDGGTVTVTDAGNPLSAGFGCTATGAETVSCPLPEDASLVAYLNDRDDSFTNTTALTTKVNGGSGDDVMVSGTTSDSFDGGEDSDTVSYSSRTADLHLALDGEVNDGQAGENDRLENIENLTGGEGSDTVIGDTHGNALSGGPGDDEIVPGGGEDVLTGGAGMDSVTYESRTDNLRLSANGVADDGSPGEHADIGVDIETIIAGEGDDEVAGTSGTDTLNGGDGNDTVSYESRTDDLELAFDDPTKHGAPGENDDWIGFERVRAGEGEDTLYPGETAHAYEGGPGVDAIDYSAFEEDLSITTRDGEANDGPIAGSGPKDFVNGDIERLVGGSGDDTIEGAWSNEVLVGGPGDDQLLGWSGQDDFFGEGGEDTVSFADAPSGSSALLSIDGVANDGIYGAAGNIDSSVENLFGSDGDDILEGSTGTNTIDGGDGNDTVSYGTRDDDLELSFSDPGKRGAPGENDVWQNIEKLRGGTGDDSFVAGELGHRYEGGAGKDSISYASFTDDVQVSSDNAANDGPIAGSGAKDDVGHDIEVLTGGSGDDRIAGESSDDELHGGDGNDELGGSYGQDDFFGEGGEDTVSFADAPSVSYANLSIDGVANDGAFYGAAGNVDSSVENLVGSDGDDVLEGSSGTNTLDGGDGNDTVSYQSRTDDLELAFDDPTKRGAPGENDDWIGIERVRAGEGEDTLYPGETAHAYEGGPGVDAIDYSAFEEDLSITSGDWEANDGPIAGSGPKDFVNGDIERLVGGSGNDTIEGAWSNELLVGGPGDDQLLGQSGQDDFFGEGGEDTVSFADAPSASSAFLSIDGVANDGLYGAAGFIDDSVENLVGSPGGDLLSGSEGANEISGGPGPDSVTYAGRSESLDLSVDNVANDGAAGEGDSIADDIETVTGGSGDDTLSGNTEAQGFSGGPGTDTLTYADRDEGVSVISDGSFNDGEAGEGDGAYSDIEVLIGGEGNDVLEPAYAGLSIVGNEGDDILRALGGTAISFAGGAGVDTAVYNTSMPVTMSIGGGFDDGLPGDLANIHTDVENLSGGHSSDTLIGDNGVNVLDGRAGDDVLIGNGGGDGLVGSSGVDRADYSGRSADLHLTPDGMGDDGEAGEGDNVATSTESVTAGSGDDEIIGGPVSNSGPYPIYDGILDGGPGNDQLSAPDGFKTFIGGDGNDQIDAADGSPYDTVSCDEGTDVAFVDALDVSEPDECESIDAPIVVVGSSGDTLYVDATAHQSDADVFITNDGTNYVITEEDHGVHQTYGCTQDSPTQVSCPVADYPSISAIAYAGAQRVEADPSVNVPIDFDLGRGDDTAIGGSANDLFHDWDGESGSDSYSGAGGTLDRVDYAFRFENLYFNLNNVADDGMAGEEDNVHSDIEYIASGTGSDTLIGTAGAQTLSGGGGADTLDGRADGDLMLGGTGVDTVDYSDRTANLTILQDTLYADGELGENDSVRTDIETMLLGSGNDMVTGGTVSNTLRGNGGNDQLNGGTGADTIEGGDGDDILIPGDTDASTHTDVLDGGSGVDLARYSTRFTTPLTLSLDGANNDGRAIGGENDWIKSNVESLQGGSAADTLSGDGYDNVLDGGGGNDTLIADLGQDILRGGLGTDTADYSARTTYQYLTIDPWVNDGSPGENDTIEPTVENLIGGSDVDFLAGSTDNNVLDGRDGDDAIVSSQLAGPGSDGDDTFIGGQGTDYFTANQRESDLQLSIGGATDGMPGETDNITASIERVDGGYGNDTLTGTNGTDQLDGSLGNDSVYGLDGNDTVIGNQGDDSLYPGTGMDWQDGGAGNDVIAARDGQNELVYCGPDTDTVNHDTPEGLSDCENTSTGADTSITVGPTEASLIANNTPEFEFTSPESPVTYECKVDSGSYSACTSPHATATLSDGTHTFYVRSVDAFGGTDSTPGTRSFTVDATAPDIAIAAPVYGSLTNDRTPAIAFSVTEAHPGTTKCEVYGPTEIPEYTCTSGTDLPTLSDGEYTLVVSQEDLLGNVGSNWVLFNVDGTAPAVSITSPANGSSSTNNNPTLTFGITEPSSHTEQCKLDSGSFGSCPSTLGPLLPGSHTVTVRSTDAAGNVTDQPSTFTVLNAPLLSWTAPTAPGSTHVLSDEGVHDWSHWGAASATAWDHKSTGGSQITMTPVSGTTLGQVTTNVSPLASWSGGVTGSGQTPSATNNGTGVTNTQGAIGRGFNLKVNGPPNTEAMVLKLYVGVLNARARLELFWDSTPGTIISDNSLVTSSTTTPAQRVYQILLRPPTAGDSLNVRWVQETNPAQATSKVRLYHATLTRLGFTRNDTAPSTADLSTDGSPGTSIDWAHWGGTAGLPGTPLVPLAKSGGTEISNATQLNGGTISQATATTLPVTTGYGWNNGDATPTSTSNIKTGIANTGGALGRGFTFTVPAASANSKTLKLYVGATNSSTTSASPAKLELYWGSSTIPSVVDVPPAFANATRNYVYTINLRHVTAGSSLKVSWSTNSTSTSHRVNLQSAALVSGP